MTYKDRIACAQGLKTMEEFRINTYDLYIKNKLGLQRKPKTFEKLLHKYSKYVKGMPDIQPIQEQNEG